MEFQSQSLLLSMAVALFSARSLFAPAGRRRRRRRWQQQRARTSLKVSTRPHEHCALRVAQELEYPPTLTICMRTPWCSVSKLCESHCKISACAWTTLSPPHMSTTCIRVFLDPACSRTLPPAAARSGLLCSGGKWSGSGLVQSTTQSIEENQPHPQKHDTI